MRGNWVFARVYAFPSNFTYPGVRSSEKSYSVILGLPIAGLIAPSGGYGTRILLPTNHHPLGAQPHNILAYFIYELNDTKIRDKHLDAWSVLSFAEFIPMCPSSDLEYSRCLLSSPDLGGWAFYDAPSLTGKGKSYFPNNPHYPKNLAENGRKVGLRQTTNLASDIESLSIHQEKRPSEYRQLIGFNAFCALIDIHPEDPYLCDWKDSDSDDGKIPTQTPHALKIVRGGPEGAGLSRIEAAIAAPLHAKAP